MVAGAGQLGSRYLQGLSKCNLPLQIYVFDPDLYSLERAKMRLAEVSITLHDVKFFTQIELITEDIDLAIVATTANARLDVVRKLAQKCSIRFWILEKVLAQSESSLLEIKACIDGQSKAWVNTPRRMMLWHKSIKGFLDIKKPINIKVTGGDWGLACNSIHFMDLLSWWTGEYLVEVNTNDLDKSWHNSKRAGNVDIFGTLICQYSGGSQLTLISENGDSGYLITITDGLTTWEIDESAGTARRSDGMSVPGKLSLQSEMTGALVDAILSEGICELPTLAESIELHRPFLRNMLKHWQDRGNSNAICVPIT